MEIKKSQDTYKHEEPPVGAEHLLLASFECCCGQVQTLLSIYVSYLQQSNIRFNASSVTQSMTKLCVSNQFFVCLFHFMIWNNLDFKTDIYLKISSKINPSTVFPCVYFKV